MSIKPGQLQFVRRIGGIHRPLRLIYLNGEAIATYLALSCNGRHAPKVFASIQSGQLERGNSPMLPVWAAHQNTPKIWVRGLWQRGSEPNFMHCNSVRDICTPAGDYQHFGQSFEGWSGRLGSRSIPCEMGGESWEPAIVRAYTRPTLAASCVPRPLCLANNVRILRERFVPDATHRYDAVLAPAKLVRRWGSDVPKAVCINPPKDGVYYARMPAGMKSSLEQLEMHCATARVTRVAFIPDAYEDEGAMLSEWARKNKVGVDVFLGEELDFSDLQTA